MARYSFNAANVAPQESIAPIPAGVYLAHITDSDVAQTKSGGEMIKLTFQVLQGPFANRKVFANINTRNPNADAERIGQSQLSALCHAVGVINLQDTAQLHQRPVMIRVTIRKDDTGQYGDRNEVRGYEAAQGVAMPAQAGFPAAQQFPQQGFPPAAPAAAFQAPSPAAPVAPAGAAAPFPAPAMQQPAAPAASAPWARRPATAQA
jgi:hypothetical protein